LTSVEQSLVQRVGCGERLDLTEDDAAVDEAAMRSWGDSRACRATVIRDILRGRLAADPDPHGLRLRGARVTGRLDLENLTTDVNLELVDCLLEEGIVARDARLAGLALEGCQLEHPAEPPVAGERLTCSVLSLNNARVIGHADLGAVRLVGARVSGELDCTGAELRNDSGPALDAEGLQVGRNMYLRADLRGGFTATGSSGFGAVNLTGARVGGRLDCSGAQLGNDSGLVLHADYLQVDQSMYLRGGFAATGGDDLGAVRLVGARVGGQLDCSGAELRNDSGPALYAESLQVDRGMFLRGGFVAAGSGDLGAVRLISARISGDLDCSGAELRNDSGPALLAGSLQVDQDMYLTDGFAANGGGKDAAVNLTDTRVGGAFVFAPARVAHTADSHRQLTVDGLTYAGVPQRISGQWRELLRDGTPGYAAQPYQQLAAGYRALGDDRQARQTLMAQRDDQLARTQPRWPEKLWGQITKVTLGYGYQPWRALWFLAAVVVVSCVLAVVLGAHGALAQTDKTAAPGRPCTVIQQVSVGLDLNLPVGTSVGRAGCDLSKDPASMTAAWLTAVGWVLRLLAWVFAALFIAGFTSAVRKT
jgi:hypothetical protein